jgi:hypothetical protein
VGRKPEANSRPRVLRVEGGTPGRAGKTTAKPDAIKGPQRRRGGCARKVAGLIRGGLPGGRPREVDPPDTGARESTGHPAGVSRGRSSGGSCAAKGRTRSRGEGRPCSRKPPRSGGAFVHWTPRVKPEAPHEERSGFPAPGETAPHPAGATLWEEGFSRENLALALRRVEPHAGAPGIDGMRTGELRPSLHRHWRRSGPPSTRAPIAPLPSGGPRSQSPRAASGSWGCRRPWIG